MDHFAGLDVSVKETSVCIVDDTGKIARGALSSHLNDPKYWRDRSVEIRALADGINDTNAKGMLEAAADDYDKLALRAQAREGGKIQTETLSGGLLT